jgi:hypothetical protein
MRIRTSGDYDWRTDLYDDAGEQLGEPTRSGAIDGACEFTRRMLPALGSRHPRGHDAGARGNSLDEDRRRRVSGRVGRERPVSGEQAVRRSFVG